MLSRSKRLCTFVALIILCGSDWLDAAEFIPLGALPGAGGGFQSDAYAVSDDGLTVVGETDRLSGGDWRAIRWTQATGIQELAGARTASAVSADGLVVAGGDNGPGACYWPNPQSTCITLVPGATFAGKGIGKPLFSRRCQSERRCGRPRLH
jgi:hypothetical protein